MIPATSGSASFGISAWKSSCWLHDMLFLQVSHEMQPLNFKGARSINSTSILFPDASDVNLISLRHCSSRKWLDLFFLGLADTPIIFIVDTSPICDRFGSMFNATGLLLILLYSVCFHG